jgi:hypothetical protein
MENYTRPFESVDAFLRADPVTLDDGRSISTRLDFHGAVRMGADGTYLIALLVPGPSWASASTIRLEGTASVLGRSSVPIFTGAWMPRGAGWP